MRREQNKNKQTKHKQPLYAVNSIMKTLVRECLLLES